MMFKFDRLSFKIWGPSLLLLVGWLAINSSHLFSLLSIRNDQFERTSGPVFLSPENSSFTALHLTGAIVNSPKGRFQFIEEGGERKKILFHRNPVRHLDADLTQFVRPNTSYRVIADSMEGVAPVPQVEELEFRRTDALKKAPTLFKWMSLAFFLFLLLKVRQKQPFTKVEILSWILLLGFSLRWDHLMTTVGYPLEGDSIGYFEFVRNFSWAHPFQNGIREPFFIWAEVLFQSVGPSTEWGHRFFTTLVASFIPVFSYLLAIKLTENKKIALLATLLVIINDFCIFNAARGERVDLYVVLLLGYFVAVFTKPGAIWKEILLALLGAAASLTWLMAGPAVVLIYIFRWNRFRFSWRQGAAFFAVFFLLLSPLFISQTLRFGDPFKSVNFTVNYYDNAKQSGVWNYEGPDRGWFQYLFVDMGLLRMVKETIKGYGLMLLAPLSAINKTFLGFHYSQPYSYFLFPFLTLGWILALLKKKWAIFIFMFAALHISVSFLGDIRDPRLFIQAVPFFAIFTAAGAVWFTDFIMAKLMLSRQFSGRDL